VDPDIVFGRLYYHLDPKYRRPEDKVRLFFPRPEFGFDGVHFPFMASVLAEMRAEERRRQTQERIAWFSLVISVLAVLVSIAALFMTQ
jgi:hypothetical protein